MPERQYHCTESIGGGIAIDSLNLTCVKTVSLLRLSTLSLWIISETHHCTGSFTCVVLNEWQVKIQRSRFTQQRCRSYLLICAVCYKIRRCRAKCGVLYANKLPTEVIRHGLLDTYGSIFWEFPLSGLLHYWKPQKVSCAFDFMSASDSQKKVSYCEII